MGLGGAGRMVCVGLVCAGGGGETTSTSGMADVSLSSHAAVGGAASEQAATSPLTDACLPGFGDELVAIPGGSFTMGSPEGVGDAGERPHREVSISAFAMARIEVTQQLWDGVMGSNP